MSKGALLELISASTEKFEKMCRDMHFAEKNVVARELNKRANILGDLSVG